MAFIQSSAAQESRRKEVLSADNFVPERHIVIETLRMAASRLGIGPGVISTLDAMISCLPPKRNHHTVFASNATLTFRRSGISDRTLRRHAAILQDVGLLVRKDSPNKKRYSRLNRPEGKAMRFGFDLTPLFEQLNRISKLAADVAEEQELISYKCCLIRSAANNLLYQDPENQTALEAKKALRRKLTIHDCDALLAAFPTEEAETPIGTDAVRTPNMATNHGQNVRHYQNSNIEIIDKEGSIEAKDSTSVVRKRPLTLPELLSACPEAAQFSTQEIKTMSDAVRHAEMLAPMIGIDQKNYEAAKTSLGNFGAAATVWAIMQFHQKIRNVGAYFRSITSGTRSTSFDPVQLVRRLHSREKLA